MATKYIINNLTGQTINGESVLRPYKVYTALLRQSGGDASGTQGQGDPISLGITYLISDNPDNFDFTVYGAPNSNVGTYFVCNQDTTLPNGINVTLTYNLGAPVATVLENTLGGEPTFRYQGIGYYRVDLPPSSPGRIWVGPIVNNYNNDNGIIDIDINNFNDPTVNYFFMRTLNYSTGAPTQFEYSNSILYGTPIEIRVYP